MADAQNAGAAGLAIIAEAVPPGFELTRLPVLHKGVLIDPYQLYESRLGGADGVVLIAAAFDGDEDGFVRMQTVAWELGLDVVVEVAEEEEIEEALELLDPDSFWSRTGWATGASTSSDLSLLEEVPAGKVVLSEGGIRAATRCWRRAGRVDARSSATRCTSSACATFEILRGLARSPPSRPLALAVHCFFFS